MVKAKKTRVVTSFWTKSKMAEWANKMADKDASCHPDSVKGIGSQIRWAVFLF